MVFYKQPLGQSQGEKKRKKNLFASENLQDEVAEERKDVPRLNSQEVRLVKKQQS